MTASERVKELRAETGLSQKKFAEAYEIPKRTIESWEAGDRVPPEYVVRLLERVVREDLTKKEGRTEAAPAR